MAENKLLNFNRENPVIWYWVKKRAKADIQKQMNLSPISLWGQPMKQEACAKYLGDWISDGGLKESLRVTISKRLWIYEIYESMKSEP